MARRKWTSRLVGQNNWKLSKQMKSCEKVSGTVWCILNHCQLDMSSAHWHETKRSSSVDWKVKFPSQLPSKSETCSLVCLCCTYGGSRGSLDLQQESGGEFNLQDQELRVMVICVNLQLLLPTFQSHLRHGCRSSSPFRRRRLER